MKQLTNIYEYNDFRKYLSDYQKSRQSVEKSFSKSEFSRRLRLPNTRSYINDVLKGKEVTPVFVERFIGVLKLEKDEAQYFRALVQFNQAVTTEEREFFFEQVISLNHTPRATLDSGQFAYYKNWYNGVIRAILALYDFKGDYVALSRKVYPPITPKQAQRSIALLRQLGLIALDVKGVLRPTDKSISSPDFVNDELVRHYQLVCLEHAQSFLLNARDRRHMIATNTLSVSKSGYERLSKLIHKFRAEVRSLAFKDTDPADRVYQLQVLFFPSSSKE